MSHPRSFLPHFDYTLQEPQQQVRYNAPSQQASNNIHQQWMQPRVRSVQLNVPSPAASVRSAVTAPGYQRSSDRSNFQQNNASPVNSRNDANLLGMDLLTPAGHVGRGSYSPIARTFNEESWNTFNLRSSGGGDDTGLFNQSTVGLKSFRHGPGSACSPAPRSDSGFYSQSVVSHDANRMDQSGMQWNMSQPVENLNVRSTVSDAPPMARLPSDHRSYISRASSHNGYQGESLKCAICDETSKCKSDFKKHKLKHDKPHRCNWPRCKRMYQGFTTVNDLDRHKKSVHQVGLMKKSYRCASESCRNKEKIWPRQDNFKQHIERMHKDEDIHDLLKRSTLTPKQPSGMLDNVSVVPMDTIVSGMDKSFPGLSNYDHVVETHTMAGQEIPLWSINLNPTDSPLKSHQVSIASPMPGFNNEHMENIIPQNDTRIRRQQSGNLMQQKARKELREVAGKGGPTPQKAIEQPKKQQLTISNAQTKSQQQRLALQKFSQAVSDEMEDSSTPVDLEQAMLRILAGSNDSEGDDEQTEIATNSRSSSTQSKRSNKVFLTKSEAIKAAQAISNLIKQSPGSAYSQPRKVNQNFATNPKICTRCDYEVARPCDLKKHMKRHEKPYGCTYPKCHKRFGAKSDWKRHENSQHFQLEAFRCDQPSGPDQKCGEHFLREELFKKHLRAQHNISDEQQVSDEVRRRRIGKNCQQQFWCGFHGDIIELKEKRNAAWDERFDHIAYHFEKEKWNIEAWVCAEENKTKKELRKGLDRYVFDENERGTGDVGAANTGPPPSASVSNQGPSSASTMFEQDPRKRKAEEELRDDTSQKKSKDGYRSHSDMPSTEIVRYCCQCHDGPGSLLQGSCIECNHKYCGRCVEE